MNKRILILLLFLFIINKSVIAQFEISIKSSNTFDSIAYLRGIVFDDKNFIPKDTIELYKGLNVVSNKKSVFGGLYYLYFPKSKTKLYLAIENKDKITINVSDTNYLNKVKSNSLSNNLFFDYQKLEASLASIDSNYENLIKQGKKFNVSQKAAFFESKNKQLIDSRNSIMKKLKSTEALFLYFDALNKLDSSIPNKKKFTERSQLLKSFNLNNTKLLFTPILKQVITEYLSYYPLQADSIIKGVDSIMLHLDCHNKSYPYIFDQLSKILKNREIQNNTIAYLYFINKYVKENKCKFLDVNIEKQYVEELEKIKLLTSQDTSLNISLKDSVGVVQNLHDYAKLYDLTLITFFDPTCDHCKVELPRMDSTIHLIEQQLALTIGKYTVCNDMGTAPEVWKAFINDHHLTENYLHVSLGNNNEIRKAYDAFTNPLFYLIKKDGRFVGKKISVNTIRRIIINQIQSGK